MLYQLPTNVQLPKELHPVFFLFVAAPAVASMAWARISGEVQQRREARLLRLHVPLRVAGGARQPLPGVQVLAGPVGIHVPMTASRWPRCCTRRRWTMSKRAMAVGLSGISAVTVTASWPPLYHAFMRWDRWRVTHTFVGNPKRKVCCTQ
ncbi:hypothetical protein QYE76_015182 [Lolium multiflorum]|uniref:Uncharacterized protein n=1 Tax=Lolium multiflorum TaxID=4521 RepID=A0AAD8U245_LOLMU|nr:hypothetical protein QYE76_015182 [Lolium multiflorum]